MLHAKREQTTARILYCIFCNILLFNRTHQIFPTFIFYLWNAAVCMFALWFSPINNFSSFPFYYSLKESTPSNTRKNDAKYILAEWWKTGLKCINFKLGTVHSIIISIIIFFFFIGTKFYFELKHWPHSSLIRLNCVRSKMKEM